MRYRLLNEVFWRTCCNEISLQCNVFSIKPRLVPESPLAYKSLIWRPASSPLKLKFWVRLYILATNGTQRIIINIPPPATLQNIHHLECGILYGSRIHIYMFIYVHIWKLCPLPVLYIQSCANEMIQWHHLQSKKEEKITNTWLDELPNSIRCIPRKCLLI